MSNKEKRIRITNTTDGEIRQIDSIINCFVSYCNCSIYSHELHATFHMTHTSLIMRLQYHSCIIETNLNQVLFHLNNLYEHKNYKQE